ncbi:MAG TPA: hypothetical protein DET40_20435 [Lentisphaeria bacterium]|nr:MAG: hypothetical protein A2X45_16330 [Lentisphaerae bacterium GWF2_50_93]HCE45920.1 hypothetical protein [Lentisphaeria bacterium]
MKNRMENSRDKAMMLGVGLDSRDGHARVTKGENFYLAGGSEETHDRMTETVIKVNEKLQSKGKKLEEVAPDEFTDILREASK